MVLAVSIVSLLALRKTARSVWQVCAAKWRYYTSVSNRCTMLTNEYINTVVNKGLTKEGWSHDDRAWFTGSVSNWCTMLTNEYINTVVNKGLTEEGWTWWPGMVYWTLNKNVKFNFEQDIMVGAIKTGEDIVINASPDHTLQWTCTWFDLRLVSQ
jgi:hypothetical protein